MPFPKDIGAGVVTGAKLMELLAYCKETGFAMPAVNCISTSSVNCVLEAAKVKQTCCYGYMITCLDMPPSVSTMNTTCCCFPPW